MRPFEEDTKLADIEALDVMEAIASNSFRGSVHHRLAYG